MVRSALRAIVLVAAIGVPAGSGGAAADTPPASQKPVSLTINPDGTAVWNGEPLLSEPALKDRIARQTQQTPRLQLDLRFHSVGSLDESNQQTLRDIVELVARYGYVHVETTASGATLTVLGPTAVQAVAPK